MTVKPGTTDLVSGSSRVMSTVEFSEARKVTDPVNTDHWYSDTMIWTVSTPAADETVASTGPSIL